MREHAAAKSGDHRRKVHRRPDTVDIHVANALIDIPASFSHITEFGWLQILHALASASDGVHADLRKPLAFKFPNLVTVLVRHNLWCSTLKLRRQPAFEHLWGLNQVIVNRNDGEAHFCRFWVGQQHRIVDQISHKSPKV